MARSPLFSFLGDSDEEIAADPLRKRPRLPSDDESDESDDELDPSSSEEEEEVEDLNSAERKSGNLVNSSNYKSPQSIKLQSSDILDCPTCCEPLKIPIYQCNNGHLACSSCCTKLKKRCSFCKSLIGDIRCRAMEKIIEATIVSCPNATYGCKHTTTYGNQSSNHVKLCAFMQCSCPLPLCSYNGSYTDLKTHTLSEHIWERNNLIPFTFNKPVNFVLNLITGKNMAIFREEKERDLIVLEALSGTNGIYVTVSCIAPKTPELCNFSCSLAQINEHSTLRLGLMVNKIQKVRDEEEVPEDGFMLIPSYMLSNEQLKMQICIGRDDKYVHI